MWVPDSKRKRLASGAQAGIVFLDEVMEESGSDERKDVIPCRVPGTWPELTHLNDGESYVVTGLSTVILPQVAEEVTKAP